jgi:predicted DNA-binding transcriptional regulator AlpA
MKIFSTRQAARKLGIHFTTLAHYIVAGKLPAPKAIQMGRHSHAWTLAEIEHVRQLLPKIANGRKTRYKKEHSTKTKTPARVPVPHKTRRPKKKK